MKPPPPDVGCRMSDFGAFGYGIRVVAVLMLSGCGYIGEPMYPLVNIPKRVTDLAAVERGAAIIYQFTLPSLTTEGKRAKIGRVEIRAGEGRVSVAERHLVGGDDVGVDLAADRCGFWRWCAKLSSPLDADGGSAALSKPPRENSIVKIPWCGFRCAS